MFPRDLKISRQQSTWNQLCCPQDNPGHFSFLFTVEKEERTKRPRHFSSFVKSIPGHQISLQFEREFLLSANSRISYEFPGPIAQAFNLGNFHCLVYLFSIFYQFFLASFENAGRENLEKTRAQIVSSIYPARIKKIRAQSGSGQLCVKSGSIPGTPKPGPDPDFCHPYHQPTFFISIIYIFYFNHKNYIIWAKASNS